MAIEHGLSTIAFPSISTGAYGYPIEEAARVALGTTIAVVEGQQQLRLVRFVLFSRPDYEVYRSVLNELVS